MRIQFFITLLLLSSFSGCLDNLLGNEETEKSSPPLQKRIKNTRQRISAWK